MRDNDDYFSRRAREERDAATNALHPSVKRAHIEFAEAYEHQARILAAEQRRSAMRLVRGEPTEPHDNETQEPA